MEHPAQAARLHLVAELVHAATGIGNHPQPRSKPCPEPGLFDDRRRPGQHRACRHVPDWAEILCAERRLNGPEGIERTVERGLYPRTALPMGFLAGLAARVGGLARALPSILPASTAHAARSKPAPWRGDGWTCRFTRFAAVGTLWNRVGSRPTWQLGRPRHLDRERDCSGRPCLHVLHGVVPG